MSTAFRKIDVDALEDDVLLPEDLYPPPSLDPSSAAQQAKATEQNVRQLVSRGDSAGALQAALADPPYGNDSYAPAKDTALATVLFIILQTPQASVADLVASLPADQQDALMKYLYRGMSSPSEGASGNAQCSAVLAWHAKLLQVAGVGCINRAMVDHRRV